MLVVPIGGQNWYNGTAKVAEIQNDHSENLYVHVIAVPFLERNAQASNRVRQSCMR